MINEDIYSLYKEIQYKYRNKEYKEALDLINKYLKIESIGITDSILNMYVDCNVALNNIEEALNTLNLMKKLYSFSYSKYFLARRYISCFEFSKAIKIIDDNEFNDKKYFHIARRFLYLGEYYLASKYFNKCIFMTDDEDLKQNCNLYKDKINKYINEGKFIEQNYMSFKKNGNSLAPGYIIYAKVDDEKYKNMDPACDKRPYLIWKIIDDNVYCFPLTTKIKNSKGHNYGYVLYHQKYLNFDSDRRIKDNIVVIKENNIEKVYEKLNQDDLKNILKDLFHTIYFSPKEKRLECEEFINEYIGNMDIEIEDVIFCINRDFGIKKYYFVLKENRNINEYECVELISNDSLNSFSVLNFETENINNTELIYSVIKLPKEEKERIMNELKNNLEQKNKKSYKIV